MMQGNETVPYALNTECVDKSSRFGVKNCSKTEYLTDRVTLTNEVTIKIHICANEVQASTLPILKPTAGQDPKPVKTNSNSYRILL